MSFSELVKTALTDVLFSVTHFIISTLLMIIYKTIRLSKCLSINGQPYNLVEISIEKILWYLIFFISAALVDRTRVT